jgi:hypothetical protein
MKGLKDSRHLRNLAVAARLTGPPGLISTSRYLYNVAQA